MSTPWPFGASVKPLSVPSNPEAKPGPTDSYTEIMTVVEKLYNSLEKSCPNSKLDLSDKLRFLAKKCQSKNKASSYFNLELLGRGLSEYPINAISLVKDRTIEILDVFDDGWDDFPYVSFTQIIKAKVKGIEEEVELYYNRYSKHGAGNFAIAIKIGENMYSYSEDLPYVPSSAARDVVETLHRALEIPKHKTGEMFNFLFFPNYIYLFTPPVEYQSKPESEEELTNTEMITSVKELEKLINESRLPKPREEDWKILEKELDNLADKCH